jgi:hypothetical protein
MARPDALLVTALQDELEAVLALGDGGKAGWRAMRDGRGFRYHVRALQSEHERGEPLVLASRARQTCANMGQGAPRTGSRNR